MKRSISMLLAILTLAGTLTLPSMAAEPEDEEGTAQEAVQEDGSAQTDETEAAEAEPEPDPAGTVSWANLESRIRSGSLSARILIENITGVEDLDYDQMYEDLRRQLNSIAQAQWMMILMGAGQAADALDQSYDSLRDVFDSIKDGELQADNADVVWQLEDTVNQVVSGGENLYITLVGLEQQAADGQRGLDTIDRNLEQLRLREQLGQVSQQTVAELEQTRAETVSQLATLDSNIRQLKIQLQNLIGEDPTGELVLGPLPTQEEAVWEEPDYEADLEAAKAASWTLRNAQLTLDDAKEQWNDDQSSYRGASKQYLYQQAEHTWNAAQLTYQSTVQSFETSFKSLYDSLASYEQALESAQSALTWQQTLLDTAQRKYELGLISRSDLLAAQDDAAAAQSRWTAPGGICSPPGTATAGRWRPASSPRADRRRTSLRGPSAPWPDDTETQRGGGLWPPPRGM